MRFATAFDVIATYKQPPPAPEHELRAALARAQESLAQWMSVRPDWRQLEKRRTWVAAKDHLMMEISIIQGQIANRWREVG